MAARTSRRATLAGAAGVPLLAACGGGSEPSVTAPTPTASSTPEPSDPATSSSAPEPTPSERAVESLVPVSDVPVGGGRVLTDGELVVTQPSKGVFRAFSAICTHRGCVVSQVSGGAIGCPCHGSRFSIEDGAVLAGPASQALRSVAVEATDGQVTRAAGRHS
ncbi:Rieske (2Fe-2S) protein [Nocardioides sp. SR21]|uniref:Rieske (2Fe-2S) protein n=1 Tax=Nocardioides sp. SR21 TaxID=2919501 RepID=UPI001FAB11F5|nr:Rieske (2Fe-2S) protein [Nocardioides sp. SR21]